MNDGLSSTFYAFILAVTGALSLFILKKVNKKELSVNWIAVSVLINIASVFIVFIAIKYVPITIFNIKWNLISNIIVTMTSVFLLKEVLSINEIIGIALAFLSMIVIDMEHIL